MRNGIAHGRPEECPRLRLPRPRSLRGYLFRSFDSLREKANPPLDLAQRDFIGDGRNLTIIPLHEHSATVPDGHVSGCWLNGDGSPASNPRRCSKGQFAGYA
jgi:hypothetical protein